MVGDERIRVPMPHLVLRLQRRHHLHVLHVLHGAEHVHLYTLNRADLVLSVCDLLGAGVPA